MPAINVVFGDMADEVYTPDPQKAGDEFIKYAKMFAVIGAGTAVCAFLQMVCFEVFAERQAPRIRIEYLRSILRQDAAWFDQLEHGAMELPGSIAADAMVMKDGMGFKFSQAIQCLTTFVVSFVAAYFGVGSWLL